MAVITAMAFHCRLYTRDAHMIDTVAILMHVKPAIQVPLRHSRQA